MSPELMKLYAMLLTLVGPGRGEADVNMPSALVLKPGSQIVAIGDSITEAGGYLRDADQLLASRYPELKLPPIKNVGISGQKAEDLVRRIQKDVVEARPDVVTISIGINDVWHRQSQPHRASILADYRMNVTTMVEMAQKAGIRVILLSPTVIGEDSPTDVNTRLRMYIDAEKQIAREHKCTLVDLQAMFFTAVAKRPNDVKDKKKWLTSDGVHMSPLGDALMAIGMLRALGVPDDQIAPDLSKGSRRNSS